MLIKAARIKNYRSIESVCLTFPSLYSAICDPNDSGKTNVVRALRAMTTGEPADMMVFPDDDELFRKEDYPKWLDTEPAKQEMSFEIDIELDEGRDIGLYQFFTTQLSIDDRPNPLQATVIASYCPERSEPNVTVLVGKHYHSGIQAEQVLKKIQSSKLIIFHNSTSSDTRYFYSKRSVVGHMKDLTAHHQPLLDKMKKTVSNGLARISRVQQAELQELLGRLETKYKVGLSLPPFDLSYIPFGIALVD